MFNEEILSAMFPYLPKAQIRMMAVPFFVGQFVMTWAKHERMLADMMARIQRVEYRPLRDRLLDSQISAYETEIRETMSGLEEGHPSRDILQHVLDEHIPLRQLRNDIVHGFWAGIGPDDEYVLKRKIRKGEDTARTIGLGELISEYNRLDHLGTAVINASRAFEGKH